MGFVAVPLSVSDLLGLCHLSAASSVSSVLLHSEVLSLTYLHTHSADKGQTTAEEHPLAVVLLL